MTLTGNNEKPQRVGRLVYYFLGDYPAEIEVNPAPNVRVGSNIITELILNGPPTPDGTNRTRLTLQITADADGVIAGVIDSSTNDPTGSPGQAKSMPLVFNVGEANGVYAAIWPNGMLKIQDRANGDYFEGKVKDLSAAIRKAVA